MPLPRPRRPTAVLAFLGLLALAPSLPHAARAGTLRENQVLVHGGISRFFDVFEPDGLAAGDLAVVVLLHGGTQDKNDMRANATSVFFALADREDFLLLIPNGTTAAGASGTAGDFNWNDCRIDAGATLSTADDVGFLSALLDWTLTRYDVDLSRIYATGASNGGMMSYRLAFELSHRLAAVGASIANLPEPSECTVVQPSQPISVLIMNGTADPLMPWLGGPVQGAGGSVISAAATRDFWRGFLQTAANPVSTLFPDLAPNDAGRLNLDLYASGRDGSELAFYAATGGGHSLPSLAHPIPPIAVLFIGPQNRDLEGAEEIWAFLARQRLTVPEPAMAWGLVVGFVGLATLGRRRRTNRRA